MSIFKDCGNDMDNEMTEFEQLERRLFDRLYFRNRVLQEIIDMAFVDIFDLIEVREDGLWIKEGAVFDSGIQVVNTKNGLKISAPYRMKALDLLGKIYVLNEKENQLKMKIDAEQLKIKQMMQQINIEKNL